MLCVAQMGPMVRLPSGVVVPLLLLQQMGALPVTVGVAGGESTSESSSDGSSDEEEPTSSLSYENAG